jgi:TonB family protein
MEIFIYILKVNIAIALLYLVYRFVFQADTFFAWKRAVLQFIVFFSLLYPFINLGQFFEVNLPTNPEIYAVNLGEISIGGAVVAEKPTTFADILPIALIAIYLSGVAFFLFRVAAQTFSLLKNFRRAEKIVIHNTQVLVAEGVETPFSFFGKIVIDRKNYSDDELHEILLHEATHVEKIHSFDVVLSELLCAFAWFNPFAWLLKHEIRLNLEYLADNAVLLSGCESAHYQLNLLQLSYKNNITSITNNFNVSPLKKRIMMMKKNESSGKSMWKYALLVPATSLLIGFNVSLKAQNGTFDFEITKPKVSVKLADNIKIAEKVDVLPEFPGGTEALYKFIADNMQYPKNTVSQKFNSYCEIQFLVDEKGNMSSLKNIYNGDWAKDTFAEIERAFTVMPKWKPAMRKGKSVSSTVTLHLEFEFTDDTPIVFRVDSKVVSREEYMDYMEKYSGTDNYSAISRKNQILDGEKVHIVEFYTQDIYDEPEIPAEFPGGINALYKYISDNLKYPKLAVERKIEGKSIVRFIVDKDGTVSNVEIKESFNAECDAEAVRVIKSLPKFTPAKQGGKQVGMYYTIPIMFALQSQGTEMVQEEIFTTIEQNPEFPGGINALHKFIGENLKYPKAAVERKIEGRTVIQFIVEKDGSVSTAKVLRGFDAECDAEAARVIKSLPKFIPGKQNGKPVRVYYVIPISFKLNPQNTVNTNENAQVPEKVLWVVDSKEITTEIAKKIKPEDIEKVEVLKDESATKLYGEKGKNGVILVTTKKK